MSSSVPSSTTQEHGAHLPLGDALVALEVFEELVEVRVEVRDVPGGADEREHLPVLIRTFPHVPGMARNSHIPSHNGPNGLDST